MNMLRLIFSFLIAVCIHIHSDGQQVHLKTGNFSVKHTDLAIKFGISAEISRVYNSTSDYKSIFGWGWASDYNKPLLVNPDGSIVTKECECEGRTNNIFRPTNFDETAKSAAIEKIVEGVQVKQTMNAEELFTYKQKLISDRGFFIDEWQRLINLKILEPYPVPEGTRLVSKTFSYEVITKTADGYELDKGSEKKYYDNNGLLTRQTDDQDWITLQYNAEKQLVEIADNFDNKFVLTYTNGLVTEVIASGALNDTIQYSYQDDELTETTHGNEKKYRYQYSRDGSHKLMMVVLHEDTLTQIAYANDPYRRVSLLVSGEDSTTYTYKSRIVSDKEYINEGIATELSAYGSKIKKSIYYISSLEEGIHFNYRTLTTEDDETEDTYYNEEGYPDKIVKGEDTTFFKYNAFGYVIHKENSEKREEVKYDPACSRMSEYFFHHKKYKSNNWSKFVYNDQCYLTYVENSEGKKLQLQHDKAGNISSLKDLKTKQTLLIKYNKLNKPIEITAVGTGKIKVTYTEAGEIDKIDSGNSNYSLTTKIITQMQALLDVTDVGKLGICKCSY